VEEKGEGEAGEGLEQDGEALRDGVRAAARGSPLREQETHGSSWPSGPLPLHQLC
jgi:hypothetical protein